ncbi:Protein kinase-like domain [Trinorchestia longiramus]|nr:Protein kinase-like domain [Trinorchestia longiramus]
MLEMTCAIDGGTRESLCSGAKEVVAAIMPSWDKSKFQYKVYTDGISNQLVGVWPADESMDHQILVRVYGNKTELFIDRSAEKHNIQLLYSQGCGPALLGCFQNGLCYSYTIGIPLTTSTVSKEDISTATITHLAELHSIELDESSDEPVLFPKARRFLNLLPDLKTVKHFSRVVDEGYSNDYLQGELAEVELVVKSLECPITLCHNDLLLANIIWNEKDNKIRFIDFEYAAPNYQPYDIANHFCEYAGVDDVDYSRYPTMEYQVQWISK